MGDLDPTIRPVISNSALLLRTGKFSDLTFTCHGSKFLVHKAVVCARSPVWAAAVEGSFQEAKTNEIEIDVADAPTLQRALECLYTGNYSDETLPSIEYLTSEAQYAEQKVDGEASQTLQGVMDDDIPNSTDVQVEVEGSQVADPFSLLLELQLPDLKHEGVSPDQQLTMHELSSSDETHTCCTPSNGNARAVCMNEKLRANALVYILADYYDIPDLRQLAVEKFAAVGEICLSDFGDICRLVYDSAPSSASDLRSALSSSISDQAQRLVDKDSLMNSVVHIPELSRDVLLRVLRNHQVTSGEKDAARKQIKEANAKLQTEREERERLVEKVNQARKCRHCGLQNNVYLEEEFFVNTIFGHGHSLRCKCRTRY